MAIEPRSKAPLLNPVLLLTKEPVPEEPHVSGKGEAGIVHDRLDRQRVELARDCASIADEIQELPIHGGKIHIIAKMFSDSFAPSWTPRGLFDAQHGCRLTAPAEGGYLVEVDATKLPNLARHISTTSTIEARTAISRVRSLRPLNAGAILRGRSTDTLWESADEVEGGRGFVVWLTPYRDDTARTSVVQTLARIENLGVILPTFSGVSLPPTNVNADDGLPAIVNPDQTAISRAIRRYRNEGAARTYATIPNKNALTQLIASGSSFRIDPVRRIEVTAPSIGAHPAPPSPRPGSQPIVAVVDGGLTANSYLPLEAWRAPPLIPPKVADSAHGNRVSSLVVHAHAWNNQLSLPPLECRLGTVQAVAKSGGNAGVNPEMLLDYIRQVARRYPDAKVWNLSFNQVQPEMDLATVSFLGHELSAIAREFELLFVISIGNRRMDNPTHQLCPPADCEAAIVVSGREYDKDGKPAGPCKVSLLGPGPEGMLKPDLSWFSTLNMLGGGEPKSGSSYAVPLISSLAAHTYANLKSPSPDLVKALLIDKAEADAHNHATGWGTPFTETLPWTCAPGTVTMAWKAGLVPGYAYYWNDIPIPPELIINGKLSGKARLTVILNPKLSESGGPNYFATRIQVALQYTEVSGGTGNLLGSMKEDKIKEADARSELAKWHPVRRHSRDFSKRGGIGFSGSTFRLRAQIYARDLFQFNISGGQRELGEQFAAFVLTLEGGAADKSIYNSTTQRLRNFVESAVLNQEIEIS
ncbi:S8 family peptidase [Shinella sp.]|uniref:S8 family peptidase n=1 Tax=Shinella sp. TaxID=1870904 RepID=UPI002896753E|nr:S8 family peptidase [Shinella sp.]